MAFLRRPMNPFNKSHNKITLEPAKKGDALQSQLFYYKIHEEVGTTE